MSDNEPQKKDFSQPNNYKVNYADGVAVADGSKPLPATTGEWLFDKMDWYGIGWLLNAGISVVAADYAVNKGGAYAFDKLADSAKDTFAFRVGQKVGTGEKDLKPQQIVEGVEEFQKFEDQLRKKLATKNSGLEADAMVKANAEQFTAVKDQFFKIIKENKSDIKKGIVPEVFKQFAEEHGADADKLMVGAAQAFSKSKAKSMLTLITLMSGGFMLMAPIKMAEDHKEEIVTKLDDWLGKDNKSPEEQAQIEARHKQLAQEPNQTWSSVMGGRIIGLIPILSFNKLFATKDNVLASHGIKGTDAVLERWGDGLADLFKKTMPKAHNKVATAFEATNQGVMEMVKDKVYLSDAPSLMVAGGHVEGSPQAAKLKANMEALEYRAERVAEGFRMSGNTRIGKIAGFAITDVLYSAVAATATMVASKALAPFFDKGGRPEDLKAVGAAVPKPVECIAYDKADAAHAAKIADGAIAKASASSALAVSSPVLSGAGANLDVPLEPFVINGHALKHSAEHHLPHANIRQPHTHDALDGISSVAQAPLTTRDTNEPSHATLAKDSRHDEHHSKHEHSDADHQRDGRDAKQHERFAKSASFADMATKSKAAANGSEVSYH